jgi:hypothetical protein
MAVANSPYTTGVHTPYNAAAAAYNAYSVPRDMFGMATNSPTQAIQAAAPQPAASATPAVSYGSPTTTGMGSSNAAPAATGTTGGSYSATPAPQGGQGAYGRVPGDVAVPPSLWQQATSAIPGLGGLTGQASQNIMNELQGQLSPETIKMIQDHAASFGVASGMPGSGLEINTGLRSLGLTSEQLQQQGLQNYLSTIQGVGGLQQNPALMAQIATQNAVWNSAPDPAQAAGALENQYLRNLQAGYDLSQRYAPGTAPVHSRGPITLGPAPSYGPAGGTGSFQAWTPGDPNNPASNDILVGYGPQTGVDTGSAPAYPSWYNQTATYYGSPETGTGTFYAGDASGYGGGSGGGLVGLGADLSTMGLDQLYQQ